MPKVKVYSQIGEEVGTLTLKEAVWGIEPNTQAIFDAVVLSQANRRQDTAKTKKRDEVSGGGKKPWKQKGTGHARQGSTRSPQWRHGGIVFGPTGDQNHAIKMNRKVRTLALKSVLSQKVIDKEIKVVDKFEFEAIKTKEMVKCLEALKAEKKALIITTYESMNDAAYLSACNIASLYGIMDSVDINVYDLMNSNTIIITKDAVKEIEEVLNDGKESK